MDLSYWMDKIRAFDFEKHCLRGNNQVISIWYPPYTKRILVGTIRILNNYLANMNNQHLIIFRNQFLGDFGARSNSNYSVKSSWLLSGRGWRKLGHKWFFPITLIPCNLKQEWMSTLICMAKRIVDGVQHIRVARILLCAAFKRSKSFLYSIKYQCLPKSLIVVTESRSLWSKFCNDFKKFKISSIIRIIHKSRKCQMSIRSYFVTLLFTPT